jgi:sialate O-acetylesterase
MMHRSATSARFVIIVACFFGRWLAGVDAAAMTVSGVFGDHMVLERDRPVPVWGTADPGERVTVRFAEQTHEAAADERGRWRVCLDPMPAAKEPRRLVVRGGDGKEMACEDVVVGDVWLCSGQSNMAFGMASLRKNPLYADDLATADFPLIRQGAVPRSTAEEPVADAKVKWIGCSPATVDAFSAAGFYMARDLHRTLDVPIGILFSAVGGTQAEQWTSRDALDTVPAFRERAAKHAAERRDHPQAVAGYPARLAAWERDNGREEPANRGEADGWMRPDAAVAGWQKVTGPARWSELGMPDGGAAWVRKTIDVPADKAGAKLRIDLGGIDAQYVTLYWDGRKIGDWGRQPPDFNKGYARFDVPADQVQAGPAVLSIRFVSPFGNRVPSFGIGSFKGWPGVGPDFRVRVESTFPPLAKEAAAAYPQIPPRGGSTTLYNGMIHPLVPFALRGAVWYQGEGDGSRGYEYRTMLPLLIADWRGRFGRADLPFLVQQLPNWKAGNGRDVTWAEVREAQWRTARDVPGVFLSVGLDIGESDDVHPANKRDIGRRLALLALKNVYSRDVVCAGPTFVSAAPGDGAIRVSLSHSGPLVTRDGQPPRHFQVAGADRAFVDAEARIDGDGTVVVRAAGVPQPEAVRYAWFNDPADPNLTDSSGLPTAPFRSDSWSIRGEPQ